MNELATIRPVSNVEAYRASTEAADLCREIVVAASSTIQNRRYVSVEGWQAIARAHGCAAGARDVERIEGGVRAIGEVRDILTGQLIATAEGFVGEDEPTWYGGGKDKWGNPMVKRADYAIRAMAQTRAMSRACRSAFAHVVVMMNAGLSTTPAEEVPSEGFDRETGEIIDATPREKIPGIHAIKARLRVFQTTGNAATTAAEFSALVKANRDDIKTIRDGEHSWWTGDGEDFEGYRDWMDRRRAELAPPPERSLGYQMLASALAECERRDDLSSLLDQHGVVIDELPDDERRLFEAAYEAREAAVMALSNLSAG